MLDNVFVHGKENILKSHPSLALEVIVDKESPTEEDYQPKVEEKVEVFNSCLHESVLKTFLAFLAEYLATFMLIFITMGGEIALGTDNALFVGIINGFGELAVIASFTHLKADFNPAYTFTFMITGDHETIEGFVRMVSQFLGGGTATFILSTIFTKENDESGNFACLKLGEGYSWNAGFLAEAILSAVVIFVIYQSAADLHEHEFLRISTTLAAPTHVGFVMVVCIMMLVPITGGSLNPARAISTAIIGDYRYGSSVWEHMEIFTLGPLVGSLLVGIYEKYFMAALRPYYNVWDDILVPEHIVLEERHHMTSPDEAHEEKEKLIFDSKNV